MPGKASRWIARVAEWRPKDEIALVPRGLRGIYVLFRQKVRRRRGSGKRALTPTEFYDVVYVGLSKAGIKARLKSHRRDPVKAALWSHFSLFQVESRVSDSQIGELEGLFRQIYRRDSRANRLNVQKTHGQLKRVRENDLTRWPRSG
jgi:hypothetical protein